MVYRYDLQSMIIEIEDSIFYLSSQLRLPFSERDNPDTDCNIQNRLTLRESLLEQLRSYRSNPRRAQVMYDFYSSLDDSDFSSDLYDAVFMVLQLFEQHRMEVLSV